MPQRQRRQRREEGGKGVGDAAHGLVMTSGVMGGGCAMPVIEPVSDPDEAGVRPKTPHINCV